MAWIESHTILINHKKLRDLARELRLRPSYIMGHLHALWHVALDQQENGDLSSWSDESIAEYSDYPGDAPQYVRLLQKYRWLDGKKIHDWLDYAGKFLTRKYSTSNREKLSEIWLIHGRVYGGETVASGKRVNSEPKATLPTNHTNLTLPTNQPAPDLVDSDGKDDDPISSQVRNYLAEHPGVDHSRCGPKQMAEMQKLVNCAGWEESRRCVDIAVANVAPHPIAYALTVFANEQARKRLSAPKPRRTVTDKPRFIES